MPSAARLPVLGSLAIVALVGAACGSSPKKSATATTVPSATAAGAETTTTAAMMPLPDYAMSYHAAFVSPATEVKVTANTMPVKVAVTGYTLRCDLAGKQNQAGTGHYHLLLDKALINMFCVPDATVSMQNVKPGSHTLEVLPTLNDHAEIDANGQSVTFDYEPTSPLPVLTDVTEAAKPSIKILSPQPGAVLKGAFDVTVQISGFHVNCDLFGKPDVAGCGHWHLNLDTMEGPMMGMGTMLGMSCQDVFHGTTTGLNSGEKHTLIALLVDNGHAPLMPAVADKVDVTIG